MYFEELVPGINIEDRKTEFKRLLEEGKSDDSGKAKETGWLKTIAAFANTEGGTLYVGVDNSTHKVISLSHDTADRMILMVRRQIKDKLEPQIKYDISHIPVREGAETRYVISITVEKNRALPVFLHSGGLIGIFIRSYGSTVQASPEAVRDLILMSDSVPFDRDTTDFPYDRSEFSCLSAVYKEKTGEELTDKALMSIGFFDEKNNLRRGAILFSDHYSGERTRITCTKWPEADKGGNIILAQEDYQGNVFETIDKALKFVESHSVKGFRKEERGRSDYISYPSRSVFEGLVNAVAHRNYYMTGTQIEVNIFTDRLEITSPGSLIGYPEIRKERNIARIIPRRRNELISAVLVWCRYMESKGSGFDKIEADYRGRGEKWSPYISSDSASFTLVLPDLSHAGGVIDETSVPEIYTDRDTGGQNDRKILSFCYSASRSASEIAAFIGIRPSTYFRKSIIARLVNEGYLIEDRSSSPALYRSSPDKVHIV